MLTVEETIGQLNKIKEKYGNLKVGLWFYSEEYPIEILEVKPCVVSNPNNPREYIVTFD